MSAGWSSLLLALAACRTEQTLVEPDPHLQRMVVQPKRLAYEADPALPHGMVMQLPPAGAVPVDAIVDDPARATGVQGDRWVIRIPIRIDRATLDRGRAHFDTFCAACHGVLGDGTSVVAEKMSLRKPRDLLDDEVRAYPAGRIFATIRSGYGMMPSYAVQLPVDDAWGVVAYLRTLELSQRAVIADLPAPVRARFAEEAP